MTTPAPARPGRDSRVRDYVPPARLVWKSAQGVTNADALLQPGDASCRLTPTPGANERPGLLLDFGQELHGGVRLDVPTTGNGKPARLRVRFGESVSEAMGTPNNDHAIHDHEILAPWMGHTEVGMTGFRFVRIDLLDDEATVDLRAVFAVHLYRDLTYRGSFTCSDDRLNAIWQTGAYTVHLCMQDLVWDGIKRDRLAWIGDLHPEALVIAAVFGGNSLVPDTLDFQRDRTPLPVRDGAPGHAGWMNGISSYSLWWLIIQRDWWRRTGDRAYLEQQRTYLLALLTLLQSHIDADGQERLNGHRFLEWPTSGDPTAIEAGLQALVLLALRAGAELCEVLGDKEAAARTLATVERAAQIRRATDSKQATALAVLAGLEDADAANTRVLSRDPNHGLSTFYGYYVLEARALAGDYTGCLDLIRRYWGGMVDAGATTFWEGFELDWWERDKATRIDALPEPGRPDIHSDYGDWCYKGLRHSLCHGWAAGPTAWLSEHVLGVMPAAPGFAQVTIQPNLGDLQWARGTVPTPHGIIAVEHERQADGTVRSQITLPAGVERTNADAR